MAKSDLHDELLDKLERLQADPSSERMRLAVVRFAGEVKMHTGILPKDVSTRLTELGLGYVLDSDVQDRAIAFTR